MAEREAVELARRAEECVRKYTKLRKAIEKECEAREKASGDLGRAQAWAERSTT